MAFFARKFSKRGLPVSFSRFTLGFRYRLFAVRFCFRVFVAAFSRCVFAAAFSFPRFRCHVSVVAFSLLRLRRRVFVSAFSPPRFHCRIFAVSFSLCVPVAAFRYCVSFEKPPFEPSFGRLFFFSRIKFPFLRKINRKKKFPPKKVKKRPQAAVKRRVDDAGGKRMAAGIRAPYRNSGLPGATCHTNDCSGLAIETATVESNGLPRPPGSVWGGFPENFFATAGGERRNHESVSTNDGGA